MQGGSSAPRRTSGRSFERRKTMDVRALLIAVAIASVVMLGADALAGHDEAPAASVVLGFTPPHIIGATVKSVAYRTDQAGDTIEAIDLVLLGNTTDKTIRLA